MAWFDWRLAVRMAAPVEAGGISPVDGWMQDMDRPIPMEPRRVGRVERPRRTGARGQDPGLDPEVRRPQRGEVRGGSTWRCNIKHATAARLRTTADLRLRKYLRPSRDPPGSRVDSLSRRRSLERGARVSRYSRGKVRIISIETQAMEARPV